MRGYFGIGIYQCKTAANIGTLWRSAHNFGADFIFTIGKRYHKQASDTTKAWRSIPLFEYESFEDFYEALPREVKLIGVEQSGASKNLEGFDHDEQAVYLLGAEDHGLSEAILNRCHRIIHIDTPMCLNVAVAGSIVMFDRKCKGEASASSSEGA